MGVILTENQLIPFRYSKKLRYQAISFTNTPSQLYTVTPISRLCLVFRCYLISVIT